MSSTIRISNAERFLVCAGLIALGCGVVTAAQENAVPPVTNEADAPVIEQIERDSEAVIVGGSFSYDPAGRRDPFESLIRPQRKLDDRPRPDGPAGMLVEEINILGVAKDTLSNPVVLIQGSDNRGYTLRINDRLYDAYVRSIDLARGFVVFRQERDDPSRIKPYRDVIKRLYLDEGPQDIMEEGS